MGKTGLRQRMLAGEYLAGTFQKTPSYEMVEVMAMSSERIRPES